MLQLVGNSVGALAKVLTLPALAGDTRTCVTAPLPYRWTGRRTTVIVPPIPLPRIKVWISMLLSASNSR
jgi:hypothetical protein